MDIEQTKVYLIMGETGEYGDYSEWIVKSFFDLNKASNYLDKLNSIVIKYEDKKITHKFHSKPFLDITDSEALSDELRSLDELVRSDYTGVRYEIKTIYVE